MRSTLRSKSLKILFCTLAFGISLFLSPIDLHPEASLTGIASFIDGDTIEIHGDRIRLFGIDAPESKQECTRDGKSWRCGQQAALALASWIGKRTVVCVTFTKDRYGRTVARCTVDGMDISAWMVRNGWARAFVRYSQDYVRDEVVARSGRLGIWAGEHEAPWDWRAKR